MELERANQRSDRLEARLLEILQPFSNARTREGEIEEPIKKRMSLREAQKAVMAFEEKRLDEWEKRASEQGEVDAGKISETIQTDASRGSRDPSRGRAI